ncbi:MAG: lipopolysaccharide heptosyltransferase, partial [Gammaproteobacteria bacterium]|nr:lipopolysaccharide heptosyltransferase [Gammaproteobacteria bacterium]
MKKILIIIQRANGDVFLASPTIDALHEKYPEAKIDLLINDDTLGIAKTLRHINHIHLYRYSWRKEGIFHRLIQELKLLKTIWRKYDLAISLTGSDRSIFFAIAAAKLSMGPVEKELKKSWWKRRLLSRAYVLNANEHIILNNVKPLRFLHALPPAIELKANVDPWARERMKAKLLEQAVTEFILFHPTAQYEYKVYPKHLRNQLFERLNSLGIPIVVTGANSALDQQISTELPALP